MFGYQVFFCDSSADVQSEAHDEQGSDHDRHRLGGVTGAVAALDLRVALHRGQAHCSGHGLLHPVHRDQPLHYFRFVASTRYSRIFQFIHFYSYRYCDRGVLRAGHGDDNPVLGNLAGDGEAKEGLA